MRSEGSGWAEVGIRCGTVTRDRRKRTRMKENYRRLALVWRGILYTETVLDPSQQMVPQPSKCRRRRPRVYR